VSRVKEIREWVAIFLTLLIGWGVWSVNSRLHVEQLEFQQKADEKYESKVDAKDFETITNNKLDKLTDGIAAVRDDVSSIKGQLARKNP
jgi:hypothetical protein